MSAVHIVSVGLALSWLAAVASAQSPYRFTFSNPAMGSPHATAVLEYFSLVDCAPCRQFELVELPALLPLVEAGRLRIVFRDLPPADADVDAALHLFCLQETENFLTARLDAKRTGEYALTLKLRDRRKARWDECREGVAATRIAAHNMEAFDRHAFVGTPAFTLSLNNQPAAGQRIWSGRTSSQFIHDAITTLPAPVTALSALPNGADPRRNP